MQMYFQAFYHQYGIRRIDHLLTPKLLTLLSLPRDAMVHYLSEDPSSPEVDVSQPWLAGTTKNVAVDYATQLTTIEGGPRYHMTKTIRDLTRGFHQKHRKFKFIPDAVNKIGDQTTLQIANYSYLDEMYTYAALPLTSWYKFWNNYRTLFANIAKIGQAKAKNHFIFVKIPQQLPSYQLLNLYAEKPMTRIALQVFDTPAELFLLQFWSWIADEHREATIFGQLSHSDLAKVNIVFGVPDGRSIVLNLGYMDSWIKGHDKLDPKKSTQQQDPHTLRKLFLKFLITVTATIPEAEIAEQEAAQGAPSEEDKAEQAELQAESDEYHRDHDEDLDDSIDAHEYEDTPGMTSGLAKSVKTTKTKPNEDVAQRLNALDKDIDASMSNTLDLGDKLKSIDQDLKVLDLLGNRRLKERGIRLDKDGEEVAVAAPIEDIPVEVLKDRIYRPRDAQETLLAHINESADFGLLSAADFKKALKDVENYKLSTDPYGSGQLTVQAMVVTSDATKLDPKKTQIQVSDKVVDKTMAHSSLLAFDHDYVKHVYKKEMLAMVDTLQKAGVIVRNHEVELDHSALGVYENHTLELKPIDGQASTLRFRLPQVQTDGTFVANGNKYTMSKQRVDLPIRKTNAFTVALTSYYGKTFVTANQKQANSSLAWLVKELNKASFSDDHPYITRVAPAQVFDNNFEAPWIYNGLANHFKSITTKELTLVFDRSEREGFFPAPAPGVKGPSQSMLVNLTEEDGKYRVVGYANDTRHFVLVDKQNQFWLLADGKEKQPLGDIYQVLHLDAHKAPVDFTDIRIFSKTVPIGVVLGYAIGFKNLVKLLDAKHEVVEGRRLPDLQPHQYVISFKNERYVLDRRQRTASMILAGFLDYERQLRQYDSAEFDKKDVYLNLLATKGLGSLYIRELELTNQLFVDPVTKSILERMGEPTTFHGLLIRATEMLETYHHPDLQDMHSMRVRGYERFPGAVYKELAAQIRQFKNKNIAGKSRVEMSPYQVWQSVMKDPAIRLVQDINPIQNLKEAEIVTYVGTGGRSKDAINKENRAFHVNDMGVVSEATVDSSDVGINAYLSANPNFEDMRGIALKDKQFNPSNLISTSALLAPGANHDDPKRVNFVSIQQSHTIAADGYHQPVVRTGYEYVIANRTTDIFACLAKDDGKVTALTADGVIVEYADGSQKGVTLGRVYGKAEGSVYPHDIVSPLKLGQKFKKGDPIAYNSGFFEPDFLDRNQIVMKNSMNVKVALLESSNTHEDASAISKRVGQQLSASTTKVRSFTVDFKQRLNEVVKVDQKVGPKDILMIIEDEITSNTNIFDQQSLEVLKNFSKQAPKANHLGVVDKIEVFYHGAKGDMSASLKTLADRSDRQLGEVCRASGKPVITGQVNDDYRVSGVPLALDKAEVKIYITVTTTAGVGDKGVYASQMKSVIGEVMDYSVHTEEGDVVDAMFGYRSIAARIVESPVIIGTTTTLLKVIGKKAVDIYRGSPQKA